MSVNVRERLTRLARWLRPRPAEWLLLGFWVFLKAVPHPVAPDDGVGLPRFELALAALELFTVRLAVTWFRTPWSKPGTPLAVLYPATVIPLVMPPAFLFFDVLGKLPLLVPAGSEGGVGIVWHDVAMMLLDRTMVGSLPLMAWLALGVHAKQTGSLALGRSMLDGVTFAADFTRDAAAMVLVILGYSSMATLTEFPFLPDQDSLMQSIDRVLFFGAEPLHLLEKLVTPWLSEWLAFCYVMYVSIVTFTLGGMLWTRQRSATTEFAFVMTATLVTGYITYTLVPVRGPMYALTFSTSIDQYVIGVVRASSLDAWRISRDCFPSLHTALSVSLWLLAFRRLRWLAWALLPIVASIPFACVYLRYHYVTDVVAGAALALLVNAVSKQLFPPEPAAA